MSCNGRPLSDDIGGEREKAKLLLRPPRTEVFISEDFYSEDGFEMAIHAWK